MQRKKVGKAFMISGGVALIIDLLIWAGAYGLPAIGWGATFLASIAIMLVFLFGLPLIFIGVALLLIGLAFVLTPKQGPGSAFLISGAVMLLVGLLAWYIPQNLVAPGSGDTLIAWMVGLTMIFVGLPLPVFGGIMLLIGVFIVLRQRFKSTMHSQGSQPV